MAVGLCGRDRTSVSALANKTLVPTILSPTLMFIERLHSLPFPCSMMDDHDANVDGFREAEVAST